MECPYCHKKMEDAFIQSSNGIYLLKEPAPLGLPRLASEKYLLTKPRYPALPVHYCQECNKVIFDSSAVR